MRLLRIVACLKETDSDYFLCLSETDLLLCLIGCCIVVHLLLYRLCIARKRHVFSVIHFRLPPCNDSTGQERYSPSAMPSIQECPSSPRVVRKYTFYFMISHSIRKKYIFIKIFLLFKNLLLCVICVSRLAESPERDSDSSFWRSQGQAEEHLPAIESSTSTDSSLIEGQQSDLHSSGGNTNLNFLISYMHAIYNLKKVCT